MPIEIKNMHMSPEDFHRSCQIGIACILARDLKDQTPDFEKMATEEIEKYVKSLKCRQ